MWAAPKRLGNVGALSLLWHYLAPSVLKKSDTASPATMGETPRSWSPGGRQRWPQPGKTASCLEKGGSTNICPGVNSMASWEKEQFEGYGGLEIRIPFPPRGERNKWPPLGTVCVLNSKETPKTPMCIKLYIQSPLEGVKLVYLYLGGGKYWCGKQMQEKND